MKKILIILIFPFYLFAQPLDESVSFLSNYILSDEYTSIKNSNDDLSMIDSLYKKAVSYHKGKIDEALLTVTFTSLAFYELPLLVPMIGIKINLPLVKVDRNLFEKKIDALPKNLFFNTPKNKFGDKDKIAHFFGSAYFSNTVTIFKLSKFMGIFVEFFEAAFKVDGFLDYRDMKVNNLGELFGLALRENPDLMPSQVLKLYNLFYYRQTN